MKNKFSKILSVFLALTMVFTNIPNLDLIVKALANPNPDEIVTESVETPEENKEEKENIKQEEAINENQKAGSALIGADYTPTKSLLDQEKVLPDYTPVPSLQDREPILPDYTPVKFSEDIVFDEIIEEDIVITKETKFKGPNILFKGDVVVKGEYSFYGNIQIHGSLIIDARATFNKGTYEILGDMRIQKKNEDGTFSSTSASFSTNPNSKGAKLVVKGDFYTESTEPSYYSSIEHKGNLELYGNFYGVGGSFGGSKRGLNDTESAIVFASKDKVQSVFMYSEKISLGAIIILNKESKLKLETQCQNINVLHDATLTGVSGEVRGTGFSALNVLRIEGDYIPQTYKNNDLIRLWNNILVEKDLIIQQRVQFNKGTYEILGDMRIQKKNEDGTFSSTSASFSTNPNSKGAKLVVKGDFYTESTEPSYYSSIEHKGNLELYGNFYGVGGSFGGSKRGLNDTESAIVFASKDKVQSVFMYSEKISLGAIIILNKESKLKLETQCQNIGVLHDATFTGVKGEVRGTGFSALNVLRIEGDYIPQTYKNNDLIRLWNNILVEKDLIIQQRVQFNKGTYEVLGDMRIQQKNEDGTFSSTSGYISTSVNNKGAEIIVKGDFYTESTEPSWNHLYETGVLELYGNFYGVGGSFGGAYRTRDNTAAIVFASKDKVQSVFIDSEKISLGYTEVENKEKKLKIYNYLSGIFDDNITFVGNRILLNSYANGTNITTIEGNLYPQNNIYLGKYIVTGDLVIEKSLNTKNTEFEIEGNLRVQNNNNGVFGATNAYVVLSNESKANVKGNLYVNSTSQYNRVEANSALELHGNYYQTGTKNITVNSDSSFIFSGTGTQIVSGDAPVLSNIIQNESCKEIYLGTPTNISSPVSNLVFADGSKFSSLQLNGNVANVRGSATFTGLLNLSGGGLVTDGNLNLTNSAYISPVGGVVHVKGNLNLKDRSSLSMSTEKDLVIVEGTVYNDSTATQGVTSGCLDIKGDYIQSTTAQFSTGVTSIVQFGSSYHQNISFPQYAKVHFYNLGVDRNVNVSFSKEPCWTNLFLASDTSKITKQLSAKHFGKAGTNAATGNYSQSFEIMSVPSAIGPVELSHSYNSQDEDEGVLGKGFVFSHNMKMISDEFMGKEHKTVVLPNGARYTFTETNKDSGKFTAEDSRGIFEKVGNNYVLTMLDMSKYTFNASGSIIASEDKLGNKLNYEVNSDGNITKIYDVIGTNVIISYTDKKITQIKDNTTGATAKFNYVNGNLSSHTTGSGQTTKYEYDSNGFLSKIINNAGDTFAEVTYLSGGDNDKKVHTVKNLAGNIDTYTYDKYGRNTTITDSNGRKTVQHFDANFSITSTTNPLGETSRTQYVMINGQNKHGEVLSETDFYGNTITYTRDGLGRITRVAYPNGSAEASYYDSNNNVIRSIDKLGANTYFVYDSTGKYLLKTATPLNGTTAYSEDANQDLFVITKYTYNTSHAMKGLIETETGSFGDSQNYIKNSYTSKGQVLQNIKYIEGTAYTTKFEYNSKNLPIKETSPDGVVTEINYNQFDEISRKKLISTEGKQSVERVLYDKMGQKTFEAAPIQYDSSKDNISADTYTGVGTRFSFDKSGNVLTKTDAKGNRIVYEYDIYGNILKETIPNGSYTRYSYDALDRKTSGTFYDSVTKKSTLIEEISYAQSGRNLATTVKTYLGSNRTAVTTEIKDYEDNVLSVKNPEGCMASKTYDRAGNVLTETDTLGNITRYTYDILGRLTMKTSPFNSTSGGGISKVTYTYDKVGNKLSETLTVQEAGQAENMSKTRKTTFEYDKWSRLTTTVQYEKNSSGEDVPASYVHAFYDYRDRAIRQYKGLSKPLTIKGLDNVTTNGDNDFTTIKTEFDYLDNVIKTTDSLGRVEINRYDAGGNLISAVDRAGGKYTATLDILGQKTEEIKAISGKDTIKRGFDYDNMGQLVKTTENGVVYSFTFDGKGNIINETGGNIQKEYIHDNAGSVLSVKIYDSSKLLKTTVNTFDIMGRVITVADSKGTGSPTVKATYTYDKGSRLITTKYDNGLTETNSYNNAGLPTQVTNKDASGKVISEYSYKYSVDGNQLSKTDSGGTTTYEYDGLNRLIKESHSKPNEVTDTIYTYDEKGNRLTKKVFSNDLLTDFEIYTYDKLDQLTKKDSLNEDYTYEYDANGNMTSEKSGKNTKTHKYDALNRLISYADEETTESYTYYANNKRESKTTTDSEGTSSTVHIWVGEEIFLDKIGSDMVNYVHGIKLIESDYGYYLYNAHGDVVQVVKDGTVISRYDYDAYGIPKNPDLTDKNDENPFRYTGEYQDLATGYIYLRARFYSPELGRFINEDPIKDGGNWHAYAGGNPMMFNDPSGLFFGFVQKALTIVAVAAAVVATVAFVAAVTVATAGVGTAALVATASTIASFSMGTAIVASVGALGAGIMEAKNNPNPYARPGQKKRDGSKRNKNRKKDNWEDNSGYRRPKNPKKHTPGRDHRKYKPQSFNQSYSISATDFLVNTKKINYPKKISTPSKLGTAGTAAMFTKQYGNHSSKLGTAGTAATFTKQYGNCFSNTAYSYAN